MLHQTFTVIIGAGACWLFLLLGWAGLLGWAAAVNGRQCSVSAQVLKHTKQLVTRPLLARNVFIMYL
jgi:hypothetical protein